MTPSQRAAFADFATARGGALHRAAYLMVGDAHLAEDLVQEALSRVYAAWPRVREPEAYARRAITTTAISWMRRKAWAERPVDLIAEPGTAVDGSAEVASRLDLWSALGALPPRQRAAVVLRYFEDLTEAQTAQAMGCSVGTVKSQVSAAIAKLRDSLTTDTPLVIDPVGELS